MLMKMKKRTVNRGEIIWHYPNDVYILEQIINQKIIIMQKGTISTPQKGKTVNYFKYEMKDTNQLIKDFISSYTSDAATLEGQNKRQNHQYVFKDDISLRKMENSQILDYIKKYSHRKFIEQEQEAKEVSKDALNYQEDLQYDQNSIFKDFANESSFTGKRKTVQNNSMQDLILQNFYVDNSQNESNDESMKICFQKYKNRDLESNGNEKYDDYRESKKQKKGLANISLRVKNIVSEHKKLTYKQVSDYVLQYSKDEIEQLDDSQRTKQIKNIKRRVYDALNVLVAVGILGKHQRCVCTTQWTNIPGKRHSTEWQKINSKIEHTNKLKRNCSDKMNTLQTLIDKYNSIAALRNKHRQQENSQKIKKQNEKQDTNNNKNNKEERLMFPVILFVPEFNEDQNDKLTVSIESVTEDERFFDETSEATKEKLKISGKNITIYGDFDCVLEMNLQQYRDLQQQKRLLQQIQEYANQHEKQKATAYKVEHDAFGEQSIENYFNDHVFQSK